jgi:hypothetical protein
LSSVVVAAFLKHDAVDSADAIALVKATKLYAFFPWLRCVPICDASAPAPLACIWDP